MSIQEGLLQETDDAVSTVQNALAVVLCGLLVWSVAGVLWRLVLVAYALFAAALRYSIVAVFLLVAVLFLTT